MRLSAFTLVMLLSASASAQTVTRGPFLQNVSDHEITIVWRTDVASSGTVLFGDTIDRLDRTTASLRETTQHEVRVTGLKPSTRYYYAVTDGREVIAGADEDHWFDTSPPTGDDSPFRFWVVGDSGTGWQIQADVRDAMLDYAGERPPDLYLHVGDMAYTRGTDPEFQVKFFDMYQSVLRNTVVWPTIGNHEAKSSISLFETGPYYEAYALPRGGESGGLPSGTEAYYSFDRGNTHFIVLNSQDLLRRVGADMQTWLEEDLAATGAKWIVATWHHPPYSKGSHNSDTEKQLREMREFIVPTLEAGGVDLVFSGHSHSYERSFFLYGAHDTPSTTNGIVDPGNGRVVGDGPYKKSKISDGGVFIVAGHGGTNVRVEGDHPLMFVQEAIHGSVLVDVTDQTLTVTNIQHTGGVSDVVTIAKTDGVALFAPTHGDVLTVGQTVDVRWVASDFTGTNNSPPIELSFSPDGGESWSVVSRRVDSGRVRWTAPDTPTDEAMFRATLVDNPSVVGHGKPFSISRTRTRDAIRFGSTWRYREGVPTTAQWNLPEHDDSAWSVGRAEFGFGNNDEATLLEDRKPNIPSYLFRKTFKAEGSVLRAELDAVVDDAIAVFINGRLVHTSDGFGALDSTTFAERDDTSDNRREYVSLSLKPGLIHPGLNTIAVMLKQASPISNDASFDLNLRLTQTYAGSPRDDAAPQRDVQDRDEAPNESIRRIRSLSDSTERPDDPVLSGGVCSTHPGRDTLSPFWILLGVWFVAQRRRTRNARAHRERDLQRRR